ncbi:MAG: tol-pal system protein YbgF [Bradymonadia bacterium]
MERLHISFILHQRLLVGGICLGMAGCGAGMTQRQQQTLAETQSQLQHLKDAYTAQRKRVDQLKSRISLLEDQLEAQQTVRGYTPPAVSAPVASAPISPRGREGAPDLASPRPVATVGPSGLPVVPVTPQARGGVSPSYAPASVGQPTRTRVLTQRDLDALDAQYQPAPPPEEKKLPRPSKTRRVARGAKQSKDKSPRKSVARGDDNARSVKVRRVVPLPQRATTSQTGPVERYRTAYAAFQRGDFQVAAVGFNDFLENWPDHAYAEGALFWLAHCAARRGQDAVAIERFRKMVKRFPKGDHVPEALLEIGLALDRRGLSSDARETLSRLVAVYPRTDAARRATARLEETRSGM